MWHEGGIAIHDRVYKYWVKSYNESSQYGIDNGRISKLEIRRDGVTVANYDRGWDVEPIDDDTEIALAILMKGYN